MGEKTIRRGGRKVSEVVNTAAMWPQGRVSSARRQSVIGHQAWKYKRLSILSSSQMSVALPDFQISVSKTIGKHIFLFLSITFAVFFLQRSQQSNMIFVIKSISIMSPVLPKNSKQYVCERERSLPIITLWEDINLQQDEYSKSIKWKDILQNIIPYFKIEREKVSIQEIHNPTTPV